MNVKPYAGQDGSKKEQVIDMFNRIAPRYDLLNFLLSFGIDDLWRRRLVKIAGRHNKPVVLDVATGTGDMAIALVKSKPAMIYGVDISSNMLEIARRKIHKKKLNHIIEFTEADSEDLPFEDNSFDLCTVAFGVRNFGNLNKGLSEMCRVLKPGGGLVVLEFSTPNSFPMKQLYYFYFTKILPWWGGLISKDKEAYRYLPESVKGFPEGNGFDIELKNGGLQPEKQIKQSFGIATIYLAKKPLQ